MDCIFLNVDSNLKDMYCHAQPIRPKEVVRYYKPSSDEVSKYCRDKFMTCPRFRAFNEISTRTGEL